MDLRREIDAMQDRITAQIERDRAAMWEQCPGCPAGVKFFNATGDQDGCDQHSTDALNARSRDAQMGGGQL